MATLTTDSTSNIKPVYVSIKLKLVNITLIGIAKAIGGRNLIDSIQ